MTQAEALVRLRASERAIRAMGVERLSMFGSTARGNARPGSDIDLAVVFADAAHVGLFKYAIISDRLERILGGKVDLVCEPAAKPRVQARIDRDRVRVF